MGKITAHTYCREKNGWFKKFEPWLLAENPSAELAEITGIMLGDGNCYIQEKTGNYLIRIAGDKVDDREYLLGHVSLLFKSAFGVSMGVYEFKNKKLIHLYKNNKNLTHTLCHFGIAAGDKKNNNVGIPGWVFAKNEYLEACIRGLVDTDGSVCPKTRNHKTPSIWFCSAIPNLRKDFKKALDILGYKCSKWVSKPGKTAQDCSIGAKDEVWRYYKEIGFSNPKHLQRFERFWKIDAPVV